MHPGAHGCHLHHVFWVSDSIRSFKDHHQEEEGQTATGIKCRNLDDHIPTAASQAFPVKADS